jgi:hypothetical protein
MSSPAEPAFLADIFGRLNRYRDAVVTAVTAKGKADYAAARRLLDSGELFPDATDDLMRQFVADCRAHGVRRDTATEAAAAVQDCTRRLRGLLARFPTVHTQDGRNALLKLWRESYGKDDRPDDADLLSLSLDLNRMGKEDIGETADDLVRAAVEHLDLVSSVATTSTVSIPSDLPVATDTNNAHVASGRHPPSDDLQGSILEAIRVAGGAARAKAIARHTGITSGYARHALAWMVRHQILRKAASGYAEM